MLFTKEEYKTKLIPQGKMIEEFIRTQIMPNLHQEIKVEFGEIIERGRFDKIVEPEFKICVYKDTIFGRSGGVAIYFDDQPFSSTYVNTYKDFGFGGNFLYYLCLEWNRIKGELLKATEKERTSRAAVFENFQV